MGRGLLVLTVLAGCSKLFGLEHVGTVGDAGAVDAPPDAHNVGVASLVETPVLVTTPLVAGEPGGITTVVHGAGDTYVPFAMTTSNGAFVGVPGEVHIAPAGTGDVAVQLLPTSRGMVMVTATSGVQSAAAAFNALAPVRFGPMVDGTWGGSMYLANTLVGMQLALPAMYLRGLGVTIKAPSGNGRLGLYDESSGRPHTLIAQAGPIVLAGGDTTAQVTPVQIAAGNYWIVIVTDGSLNIPSTTASPPPTFSAIGDASMPLPATAPVVTPMTFTDLGLYVVGAN